MQEHNVGYNLRDKHRIKLTLYTTVTQDFNLTVDWVIPGTSRGAWEQDNSDEENQQIIYLQFSFPLGQSGQYNMSNRLKSSFETH